MLPDLNATILCPREFVDPGLYHSSGGCMRQRAIDLLGIDNSGVRAYFPEEVGNNRSWCMRGLREGVSGDRAWGGE
jgi:hypothetical protein